ncbi:hypothetical protein Tco_0568397 [Tanacetum coccineum]
MPLRHYNLNKSHLPQLTINLELRLMQGNKAMFSTGKLWFKISLKDTMRLIQLRPFQEQSKKEKVYPAVTPCAYPPYTRSSASDLATRLPMSHAPQRTALPHLAPYPCTSTHLAPHTTTTTRASNRDSYARHYLSQQFSAPHFKRAQKCIAAYPSGVYTTPSSDLRARILCRAASPHRRCRLQIDDLDLEEMDITLGRLLCTAKKIKKVHRYKEDSEGPRDG